MQTAQMNHRESKSKREMYEIQKKERTKHQKIKFETQIIYLYTLVAVLARFTTKNHGTVIIRNDFTIFSFFHFKT